MKLLWIISVCFDVMSTVDQILHSSDTGEMMKVQWDSTSALYRLQESLWFNQQGNHEFDILMIPVQLIFVYMKPIIKYV